MQAISVEKPNLPEPPTFSTPEEERLHRKQRLAAAFRLFSRFGFNEGHIAQTLGNNKAVILKNHGLLTVGHSVDEAAWWFITMERTCQAQLLAEAAGKPEPIKHEYASLAQSQVGSHYMGWFSFQPLYEMMVRQEPDLLE
ncbi:hypothetical protein CI592_15665 [Fischerella thermalis CCMEE 5328]|nr:hypothetical protein CI592_15665 [Fischerella thermalis CCMEE 5328]